MPSLASSFFPPATLAGLTFSNGLNPVSLHAFRILCCHWVLFLPILLHSSWSYYFPGGFPSPFQLENSDAVSACPLHKPLIIVLITLQSQICLSSLSFVVSKLQRREMYRPLPAFLGTRWHSKKCILIDSTWAPSLFALVIQYESCCPCSKFLHTACLCLACPPHYAHSLLWCFCWESQSPLAKPDAWTAFPLCSHCPCYMSVLL